jgi:2-oxoglutarate/2-oxoacid ferredoxin oxidoreductase subunit alpha
MKQVLMKGNEALAEAAIRAGSRFYSGYPITPQTEILEYMSWRMEEVGGDFIQTESELSGINMILGASAAGARVIATSSGPGFTLFQEGISYLVAADLPAVIVDVMRYGNGLGDVGQSQGDYWQLTRGGGHGDYRTIVLAPNSVQENADLAYLAFDLAEKYRHPVIIGSDAAIGQMVEKVELPEMIEHDIDKYDWSIKGCKKGDEQKKITNRLYYMDNYDLYLINKYKEMELNEQRWEAIQIEDAEVVIVSYGISSRVCIEAVETARAKGIKVGLIRAITLWPFPVNAFKDMSVDCKALMTVEMNILGQMVDDVVLATGNKYPVYSYATVKEVPETEIIIGKIEDILAGKEV